MPLTSDIGSHSFNLGLEVELQPMGAEILQ